MSSTSSPALLLELRSRRTERLIVLCVSTGVIVAPWLYLSLTVAAAASVGCLALLLWGLRRAGWVGGPGRIDAVRWDADGRWTLTDRNGVAYRADLHPASRVAGCVLWLHWRREGALAPRALLFTVLDSPAEDLRRMAVRLRIEGPQAVRVGESRPTVAA